MSSFESWTPPLENLMKAIYLLSHQQINRSQRPRVGKKKILLIKMVHTILKQTCSLWRRKRAGHKA